MYLILIDPKSIASYSHVVELSFLKANLVNCNLTLRLSMSLFPNSLNILILHAAHNKLKSELTQSLWMLDLPFLDIDN